MKKKLRSSKGMMLTELIIALAIVSLIGVALTAGINGAVKVYRDATRLYEAETLCGTILTYLEDEFRFGRNIQTVGGEVTFDSQAFGSGVHVFVDDQGKVRIGTGPSATEPGYKLLADTAYTGLKLEDTDCRIEYTAGTGGAGGKVEITVAVRSGFTNISNISVEHTVTVAPLGG